MAQGLRRRGRGELAFPKNDRLRGPDGLKKDVSGKLSPQVPGVISSQGPMRLPLVSDSSLFAARAA